MTSIGSTAQVRELQPLIERRNAVASGAASEALVARMGLRRRRGTRRRLGLLRLAPRLVLLSGRARQPNWPSVAAGIGSAVTGGFDPFTGGFDPDDAPWCA